MKLSTFFATALVLLAAKATHAANGDTIKVTTHQGVVMTTDPGGSGYNENRKWGVFPNAGTPYRKVYLEMRYKCPAGMSCGEWDYIDNVILRRVGGVNGPDMDIELVRFITPYGLTFNSTWNFRWQVDITDFAYFLYDSVEIGYVHTGYETSVGRGWDVTLEFNLVEGPWVWEPIAVTPLWNGSYPFGNPNNPIENYLTPVNHAFNAQTEMARVRIHHTGHGFDNNDGCSEFCDRYRDLIWDGALAKRQQLWRKCGFNEVFPQGGTWVYDRGNWCPGATVYPFTHDFIVNGGATHNIDIDMEPYIDAAPSGNEVICSYLIEYRKPVLENDVRVDRIFRPTNLPEYNRINPICDEPLVEITNVGTNDVTMMRINYGYSGQAMQDYYWYGVLAPGKTDTVRLAGQVNASQPNHLFTVAIPRVNWLKDKYPQDNTATTLGNPVLSIPDTEIYLELKTNNEPLETGYDLTDTWGNVLYSRPVGSLAVNTVYKDTFQLNNNTCYRFVLHDIDPYGGDGLSFWANPNGGNGYARLRKVHSVGIVKVFPNDFGSRVEFNFAVGDVISSVEEAAFTFDVQVSPNPSNGVFALDCVSPTPGRWQVDVFDVLGNAITHIPVEYGLGGMHNIDLSRQPAGMYLLRVTHGAATVTKRLCVVR